MNPQLAALMPVVYDELRRIAARYIAGERPGQTLQATGLVNEAFMRLAAERPREFQNRTHFVAIAALSMRQILVQEHLPYVMPIVFSTTMNNINWSIGLEVTLSVLGFTDINTPTIGVLIYWANQHTALVAGVWWWIFFPVAVVIVTFVGLFLLAVSMNEYIDPRSRLSRIGA